jgi:hypothetical protein
MSTFHLAGALALAASSLGAQGTLSTQGYGYPQGQLSTRALSMGGAIGEIDASSALNPASLGRLGTRTVLFQIEPEYRTNTSLDGTDRTTTARYPMVNIGVPFGTHWVFGVSAASLLDRTWQTTRTDTVDVGGDLVESTSDESSNGAINDLRVAAAWTNRDWLYIGAGVSAITGRNVLGTVEEFADSSFNAFQSNRILSYSGTALSAGVQLTSRELSTVVGVSYRMGNALKMSANDTTLARGKVPNRFGASVAFTGIEGTVLAARVARDEWSRMTPMLLNVASGEQAHDSWEIGGGAEVAGPRLLGQTFLLRAGGRSRTLPFEAAGKSVRERSASFGSGASFGGGRMSADLTLIRQWRNADLPSVKERAWTISLSLTARP